MNLSTRCDPIKPAPPVIRIFKMIPDFYNRTVVSLLIFQST